MAINTKNKRKLICQNKTYYWYVASDWESDRRGDMLMLHITAADRSLIRKVPLLAAGGRTAGYAVCSPRYRYAGDRPADH